MSEPWEIIKILESNNSRLFKEKIIAENLQSKHFQNGLKMCLDPLVTFGVKQIPTCDNKKGNLKWEDFQNNADMLVNRTKTGHAARDLIQDLVDQAHQDQWDNWYRRILIKDLRCGVSEKTVNNVAKKLDIDFKVPVFKCMLAHDGIKHPKKIKGKCFVEYKYDGVRVIAIVKNGSTTLYSRNGKIFNNFPHIESALSKKSFNNFVFDGEVMSEDFQALMKQVHRKSGAKTDDSFLALFDCLPLNEFNAGKSKLQNFERKNFLDDISEQFDKCIRLVDYETVNFDTEDGQSKFTRMNKEALEKGYEGLMIKPMNDYYECKRSHAWLKIKPFIEVSLKIDQVHEGTGRHLGKLGSFTVKGKDDGKYFSLNVGSGLSDQQREEFWHHKDSLIGKIIEIRADAITKSIDSESYSLRFPRFKTFRGFEINEKF